jgi:hypothetical protein
MIVCRSASPFVVLAVYTNTHSAVKNTVLAFILSMLVDELAPPCATNAVRVVASGFTVSG